MGEASAAGWEAFRLPLFNGDDDFEEWVFKLETFFDFTGKPDGQRIIYATNRLTGKALAQWRDFQQQPGYVSTKSWDGFKSALIRCLDGDTVVKGSSTTPKEVATLQQGDASVAEYTQQFLELFISGLHPQIGDVVKSSEPKSFSEAINLASTCEKLLLRQPAGSGSTTGKTSTKNVTIAPTVVRPATPKNQENQAAGSSEEPLDDTFMDVKRCFITYADDDDYGYWFRGSVSNHPATFAHHNTSDNLITSNLVKRLDLPTVKCRPYVVEAMNGTRSYRGDTMVRGLEYEIEGGLRNKMDFAIVDKLERHDVLLGWPFFGHANKSVVFTKGGKVLVGPCTLQLYTGCPN